MNVESNILTTDFSSTGESITTVFKNIPLVVIAGRPNVGKSTLFNRLSKSRRVITDPTPGVTRDPIEAEVFINENPIRLMDTGGFKLDRDMESMEGVLDELVVEKTLASLKKADLILLLLDATEISGEDEEFIQLLRPYWDKLLAVVNKTEGGRFTEEAQNYYRFGFKQLFFISAEHGDNIQELKTALINRLDFSKVKKVEEKPCIHLAVLGKPNTGKSTLCNMLTNTESSIVSDYAGTTRDVVEGTFMWKGRQFQVLDTAGIRRKARVKENIEYYSVNRAIKSLERCEVVLYIIDAVEGLTEQDKKVIGLAHKKGRGIIFVLNKWDLQEQTKKSMKKAVDDIHIMFGHMAYAPIMLISAKYNEGIKPLLNSILEVHNQLLRKIETGTLNMALNDWTSANRPPSIGARSFKIKYMVQTSVNPVAFLVFANKADAVSNSYLAYLQNKIRQDLGFSKIPVSIEIRAGRKKWEQREK